jgi:hypothetical protein
MGGRSCTGHEHRISSTSRGMPCTANRRLAVKGNNAHHLCPPNGLANSPLAFNGESGNISTINFAHVGKVPGENGGVESLGERIDVELMKDV